MHAAKSMSTRASRAGLQNPTVESNAPTASQARRRSKRVTPTANVEIAIAHAAAADGARNAVSVAPARRTLATPSQWKSGGFDAIAPSRRGTIGLPPATSSRTTILSRASPRVHTSGTASDTTTTAGRSSASATTSTRWNDAITAAPNRCSSAHAKHATSCGHAAALCGGRRRRWRAAR